MNIANKEKETINLPKASVGRLWDAMRFFETAQDEIEDFLISRNKTVITKIKKSREEHLSGKAKDFRSKIYGSL